MKTMKKKSASFAPKKITHISAKDGTRGKISRFLVTILESGIFAPVELPVIVLRGTKSGPTVVITAAIHGNELNGIRIIQRLVQEIQTTTLKGCIIAVPVLNVPGFLSGKREFQDGSDLNRLFPGKDNGTTGQAFVHNFTKAVLKNANYLIDFHTANTGRENSLYVRADMTHQVTSWMARLQHPQIILHNKGPDGSLRGAAMGLGIPAITVEVGNPLRFQPKLIESSLHGIRNVLGHLKMIPLNEEPNIETPVICKKSNWLFTDAGGLMEVFPQVAQKIKKGETIARLTNIFGDPIREYKSPEDGVVIGKNVNPVAHTGTRILHLGLVGDFS